LQGEEVGAAEYARFRGKLLRSMLQAREVVEVKSSRVGEGHDNEMDPWGGWRDVKVKDVDTAMLRMNRHGFLEMDWVAGIDDLAKMGTRETHGGDNRDAKAVDDTTSGLGQVKRADTMFQEKYDYLNDRRKKELTTWKQGMLRRIRASGTGRPGHDDAMDLDG
jgi:origin recognition complex subunit 6